MTDSGQYANTLHLCKKMAQGNTESLSIRECVEKRIREGSL
jgi:hypothetical protein